METNKDFNILLQPKLIFFLVCIVTEVDICPNKTI